MTDTPSNSSPYWARIWATASRLPDFSYFSLSAESRVGIKVVMRVIGIWEEEGVIERIDARPPKNRQYFRVKEGAIPARFRADIRTRPQSPEQNMWTAMRGLSQFTPTDLAAHATTDEVAVSLEAARRWCQALTLAGYLRVRQTAVPGKRDGLYQLIQNTGPLPPRTKRVTVIYDGNNKRPMHIPEVDG